MIGGHDTMLAICNRFYDLMDEDAAYAELRAMYSPDLIRLRTALAQAPSAAGRAARATGSRPIRVAA